MNKIACMGLAVASACASTAATAQSSVSMYGLLDTGVMYVNNIGGHSVVKADPGEAAPNLFGITGKEDLGGGLKAIFKLEGMFDINTGTQSSSLFAHQSYVGLADDRYGALTFGLQMDAMFTSMIVDHWGPSFPFISSMTLRQGSFGFGLPASNQLNAPGPNPSFDPDRGLGIPIANAVKYTSPTIDGLTGTAMYSFGGVAGSYSQNSGESFGVNYHVGGLVLNGAYTYLKSLFNNIGDGNFGIRNVGVGAAYNFANAQVSAMYTSSQNTMNGARVGTIEADATYAFSPFFHANFSYQYMKGNSVLANQHAHQETLSLNYALSKRTSIYSGIAYQQATGMPAWILLTSYGPEGSSTGRQFTADIGIEHVF